MSARRRLAAGVAVVAWLVAPGSVAGHAIGGTYQLPVPLTLYLGAAAVAVAASFVVAAIALRPATSAARYPALSMPDGLMRGASVLLSLLGLAWWAWALWAAFVIGDISTVPAVLFWIVLWVGLPILAVLAGNGWRSFSPFRTLYRLLDRAALATGIGRLALGIAYPSRLARWPAVALLFIAIWAELVLPGSSDPLTVGLLLAGYTLVTVGGMLIFGPRTWTRNGEMFAVLLVWFGRIGPIGRRGSSRRTVLRPWFAGLTDPYRSGWSDVAFIILALAGVTFDGLHETFIWSNFLGAVSTPLGSAIGYDNADLVSGTLGLLLTWLLFVAAFTLAAWLTRRMSRRPPRFEELAGAYAATLLPIAAGYMIAHYLTLFLQGLVWLPELLTNPNASAAPSLDWFPISWVWYLSVGGIVIGHIAAIVLAHRLALRDGPSSRFVAGLPLVVLMVGYTVLSLWIIAQPITLNPIQPA